ncbi:hypothetical protein [Sporomusa termitida]|uniref:hypothetical protein n=1 Tax=Sporomusa termitida TaxID=2377 RepID=UPI0014792F60|nr:hypothetical protein [Sporomusa termitida]
MQRQGPMSKQARTVVRACLLPDFCVTAGRGVDSRRKRPPGRGKSRSQRIAKA